MPEGKQRSHERNERNFSPRPRKITQGLNVAHAAVVDPAVELGGVLELLASLAGRRPGTNNSGRAES